MTEALNQNQTTAGNGAYHDLMKLQAAYLFEDPQNNSEIVEPLSLALGRFFMALLPTASSAVILTLTGCCLTELTAAKLEMDFQRRKATRPKRKPNEGKKQPWNAKK